MSGRRSSPARRLGLVAALVLVGACGRGPTPEYEVMHDIAPLQDAFKASEGKVQALFLASPT